MHESLRGDKPNQSGRPVIPDVLADRYASVV